MAPWTCAWQCRCGQQNWNTSVNCVKCNGHWKSSKKKNGTNNHKGRQRSKSQKSQISTSELNLLQQRYNLAWAMREPVQELASSISILRRMLISERSLHQQSAWTETTIARMMLRVEAPNKEVASLKDHLQAKINVRDNLQDQLDALKRTKMEIHHASIQQAVQLQVEAQLKPMADQMMQMQQMMEAMMMRDAIRAIDATASYSTDRGSQITTIIDADTALYPDPADGDHGSGHVRGMDHGEGEGRGLRERLGGRTVLLRATAAQQSKDFSIEESKHPHPENESARILQAACQRQGQPQRRSDIETVAKTAEDHRVPSSDAAQMDPCAESDSEVLTPGTLGRSGAGVHTGPQVLDLDSRIPIEVAIVGDDPTDSIRCKLGQIGLLTRLQQEGCQIDLDLDVNRVGLHAHAQLGLDMCPTSEHVAGQISIFVDGSFDEQDPATAAWAMAVVAKDRAGAFSFLGARTGKHEAEGFVIESDSVSAIQFAEGSAQSSAHPEFGAMLRHLVVDLRARYDLTFRHVPSHKAHPWNELVDGLSKRRRTDSEVRDPDWAKLLTPAVGDPWSWVTELEADRSACPEITEHDGQICFDTPDAQSRTIDTGALQRWWEETTAIAQRMSVDVVSVDANARVGSISSTAVGNGGWMEEENVSGTCFHQFMCELGLVAPSTFSDPDWSRDTEPSGFTFVKNGAYHRIDYVLVKPHFVPAIVFEQVWSDLDDLMEVSDHFPTVLGMAWAIHDRTDRSSRIEVSRPRYNRKLTTYQHRVAIFKSLLCTIPLMPWSADINKHYSQVQEQILWAAAAAFPVQGAYPRKPYTDQLILYFVKWRRKNKAVLRAAPDKRAQAMYNWANALACLWELGLAAWAFLELLDFDSWDGALRGFLSAAAGLLKKKLDIDKTDTLERMVSEMSEAIEDGNAKKEWQIARYLQDAETDCLADSTFVDDLCVMAVVQSAADLPQAMSDVVVTISNATVKTILGMRLGRPDQPHVANEQVLLDVNRLAVTDILRLMRLRYLARLAETGQCLACGVDFVTRPRLLKHLRHARTGCLELWSRTVAPHPDERYKELWEDDRALVASLKAKGMRATEADVPARPEDPVVVQLPGALEASLRDAGAAHGRPSAAGRTVCPAPEAAEQRRSEATEASLESVQGPAAGPAGGRGLAAAGKAHVKSKRSTFFGEQIEQRHGLARLVTSSTFELTMAAAILLNTLCIAAEAQYNGMESGYDSGVEPRMTEPADKVWPGADRVFMGIEWFYGLLFTAELVLKLVAVPKKTLKEAWTVIDVLVVVFFWIESLSNDLPFPPTLIRLLRLVRVLRLVKTIRGFASLYLMLQSIKGSVSAVGWSMCVLLLGEMMLAVVLNLLMSRYWEDESFDLEDRQLLFSGHGGGFRHFHQVVAYNDRDAAGQLVHYHSGAHGV
ncbi:unnamed protein product [Prorocentrum cordatum]|uniref:Ion transport domain-containing protein n=1 Tax=Prorocentrum cordatum TaxID=2364126 RepID=A0ABN9T0P7_9DINO|nr:unnamed protein product [Polarella glacialis]